MTAYEQHRNLVLALKRGEKVSLRDLNHARRKADHVGAWKAKKAAEAKA